MPVGIGGIGDIVALLKIVQGFVVALDGSRGSATEYQEVRRELEGLEAALRCHQHLLQARRDDPALNAIFTSTKTTAEDCQRCIEAFSQQTVKFDQSLGVGNGGNVCRDVTRKVRWHMEKKQEVVKFRAELGQHISTLNMLFGLANLNMQRITTADIKSKLDALEDKIDLTVETQANLITELQAHIDEGNRQNVVAVKSAQDETTGRLGWLGNCLFELKGIVSEIFTQCGTTLSGIQRIEQTLSSRSDLSLIRTFTLEDPLGRITQIDLAYVSSFDALDAMLEICFRTLPGHDKVAKKDYVFQDEKTNREIKRSTPWSCALLPGQHVQMGLLFRKRSSKTQRHYCPYCHLVLAQSQEGFIPCKCGMSHQRRTETMDINEEEDIPAFDLFDASSSDSDDSEEISNVEESSTVLAKFTKSVESRSKAREEMSVFKRVIVVEVEMNIKPGPSPEIMNHYDPYYPPPGSYSGVSYYPFSATPSPAESPSGGQHDQHYHSRTPAYHSSPRQHIKHTSSGEAGEYYPRESRAFSPIYNSSGYYATVGNVSRKQSTWSAPRHERRNSYLYRTSYGDGEEEYEYVDHLIDGVIYRQYIRQPAQRDSFNYRGHTQAQQSSANVREDPDGSPFPSERNHQSSTMPLQWQNTRPSAPPKKSSIPINKATEADARKHRIPPGHSLKNWDPSEEPIMLLGSVFDGNSLGKWIYDWTVSHYGFATPIADMAGDFWLLLIQLTGKIKRAEECMPRIQAAENKEMVDDFIESGERLTGKLKKLLKSCETSILKAVGMKTDVFISTSLISDSTSPSGKLTINAQAPKPEDSLPFALKENPGPSGDESQIYTESKTATATSASQFALYPTSSSGTLSTDARAVEEENDFQPKANPTAAVITPKESTSASERQASKAAEDSSAPLDINFCTEFVDTIFGEDRLLQNTEKLMSSFRLWNLRFDANCEDILRRPEQ